MFQQRNQRADERAGRGETDPADVTGEAVNAGGRRLKWEPDMSELLCASDGDPAFEETRGEMKRLLSPTQAGTATATYGSVPQRLLPDIMFHFLLESRLTSNVLFCVVSTLFLSYAAIFHLSNVPFCLWGSDTIEENTVNSLILFSLRF